MPPGRLFADSLAFRLDSTVAGDELASFHCGDHTPNITRFCNAFVLTRRAELSRTATDSRAAEFAAERSVSELAHFAPSWYVLGRIRLALANDTLFSRGGALMGVGESYLTGAAHAFAESVRRDHTFAPALIALARTPRGRESSGSLAERVKLFRKLRAVLPAFILPDVALFERAAGSVDSAAALEESALASGAVDSGVVSLELARDLYRVQRASEGRATLIRGAGTRSALANAAYRRQLAWVASPAELASWDSLAPSQRSAWIADFWQKRDVAGGWQDGARLVEHYRRIEYAFKTFPLTLPQTGRHRLLVTTPADLELKGVLDFVMHNPDCFPDAARIASLDLMIGTHASHRAYQPTQDQIDDRGVIWIRNGPPTKRSFSNVDEAAEVWRYDSSPTPLVLQFHEVDFDGTNGASTLVPTLITSSQATLDRLCDAERSLCVPQTALGMVRSLTNPIPTSSDHVSVPECGRTFIGKEASYALQVNSLPRPLPEQIQQARDAGLGQIGVATTTDRFSRTFTHAVHPGVQIVALSKTRGEAHLLAAYALPASELHVATLGGEPSYSLALQLIVADAHGTRHELDTVLTVPTHASSRPPNFVSGLLDLPVPTGLYHASLLITQADGRGALASLPGVIVGQLGPAMSVSSLALGSEAGAVSWNSGTTDVPLNPTNSWSRSQTAETYFQLAGLAPGQTYAMKIELFRAGDAPNEAPQLSMVSELVPQATQVEVSRSLGLRNLDAGRYRVRVTVSGASDHVTTSAWLTINR